jgi:hypothetical protein
MHQFEGSACHKGARSGNAEQGRRLNDQKGTQALSAVQRGVLHRRDKPRRSRDLARKWGFIEKPREQLLGFSGDFRKTGRKGIGFLAHHCIDNPLHVIRQSGLLSRKARACTPQGPQ